jgi:hypothetical protein
LPVHSKSHCLYCNNYKQGLLELIDPLLDFAEFIFKNIKNAPESTIFSMFFIVKRVLRFSGSQRFVANNLGLLFNANRVKRLCLGAISHECYTMGEGVKH